MQIEGLENVLFDSGGVRVVSHETSKCGACWYKHTNETYSLRAYSEVVDADTVVGIIGGGEQLFSFAQNPKVEKIIGIDMNETQVGLFLGKLAACYDERQEAMRKKLIGLSNNLWGDPNNLNDLLDNYYESEIVVHGFGDIYSNLRRRLNGSSNDIEIIAIAGDALKIFPYLSKSLESDNVSVYLSNLPEIIDYDLLFASMEGFFEKGCDIIMSGLYSDHRFSGTGRFASLVCEKKDYNCEAINTFEARGHDTFSEIVYVLTPE